ncbi:universal stress protein [Azospirillum sp. INR13]|uniref:universal stress protein n=1 Tax=Azospirillum sp. INR13 TaxID=2596919 RepID=UPI0018920F88|nr:universal stress protein [Azospirillum sp. INR13]MBF5094852.1 universal stress protein [Azospirillum sp. INR13]
MKTVLAATDLSRRSERAVAQAAHLAARQEARLIILHVVDDELPKALFESERKQALQVLDATVGGPGYPPRDRVSVHAVGGLDFQVILKVAAEEGADMIALGAHRRALLEDILTGTTVERVVRHATAPVLVVKRPAPGEYPCTLAAVDLTEEAAGVLRLAHRFSGGQTLYAMHVLDDTMLLQMAVASAGADQMNRHRAVMSGRCETLLREISRRAGLADGDCLPFLGWGVPAPAILSGAKEVQAGLTVVGTQTHARGAMERLLLGSVAECLLLDSPCDVLVVPVAGSTPLPRITAGI